MALIEPRVAPVPVRWLHPDPRLEASEDSPTRRAQRARRAAAEIARDFRRLEGETAAQLLARLARLRRELLGRLGAGVLADHAAALDALLRDVDRLIADATRELAAAADRPYGAAQALGVSAAEQPVRALQVQLPFRHGGADADDVLVRAARDNTVDLLSPPMQQFAAQIRTGIRRVAIAGGQRMEELQRLQRQIADAGLDHAAYRAERIVRTELGRVFGAATYARLEDLARTFSFLKKAWKATNDRRTRLGHREASQTYGRGKGIPIADRFQITVYDERSKSGPKKLGVVGLRFPIDPLAEPAGRLAAASTILCRCHAAVDVDVAKYAEFARMRVQLALGGPAPSTPAPPLPTPNTTPATPPPGLRRRRQPRAPRPPRQLAPGARPDVPRTAAPPAFPGTASDAALRGSEDRIRGQALETGFLYNTRGQLVAELSDGKTNEIRIPRSLDMRDGVFTHNHPRDSSFSPEDVEVAVHRGLLEIRAVTRGGVYRLRRLGASWPAGLAEDYRRNHRRVRDQFIAAIDRGEMTPDEANQRHWIEVMRLTIQHQPGVQYLFEPLP